MSNQIIETWEIENLSTLNSEVCKEFSHMGYPTNSSIQFKLELFPNCYLSSYSMLVLSFIASNKSNDEVDYRLSILGSKRNVVQGKFIYYKILI